MKKIDIYFNQESPVLYSKYKNSISNYTSYIYFLYHISNSKKKVYICSEVTFVDTGKRRFAVTNASSIKKYLKLGNFGDQVKLGPFAFEIENRIIDSSSTKDLLTFEVSSNEIGKLNCMFCYSKPRRSQTVQIDDIIIFTGYPEIFNNTLMNKPATFDPTFFQGKINNIEDEGCTFSLDEGYSKIFLNYKRNSEFTDICGFSGTGVYIINKNNSIMFVELAGFIQQDIKDLDNLKVRYLDVINEYGEIN